ncbi:MAG: MBL fold metallo-hydrolase [Candidatus Saccharimonadaceae bacterium]
MKIKVFEFNPIAVNTYVLYDETGECVIIDAACFYPDEQSALLNFILDKKLTVKHLLSTHLHFDHIFGVNFIEKQFNVKMEAHIADEFLLETMDEQLAIFGFKPNGTSNITIGIPLDESDIIEFGNQKLTIKHIPGHSPGSIVFYNKEDNLVISGDVLFNGSIGRTDLMRGNHSELLEGIQTKLFTLPGKTMVYPGHGPGTTVEKEIKSNPFFN